MSMLVHNEKLHKRWVPHPRFSRWRSTWYLCEVEYGIPVVRGTQGDGTFFIGYPMMFVFALWDGMTDETICFGLRAEAIVLEG